MILSAGVGCWRACCSSPAVCCSGAADTTMASSRSWAICQDMPQTMRQLAWVQFFSWFALFAMWIYTTAAVTSHVYRTTDTTSALYNDGANWVGVLFRRLQRLRCHRGLRHSR